MSYPFCPAPFHTSNNPPYVSLVDKYQSLSLWNAIQYFSIYLHFIEWVLHLASASDDLKFGVLQGKAGTQPIEILSNVSAGENWLKIDARETGLG